MTEPRAHQRDLMTVFGLTGLAIVSGIVFLTWPEIDLAVAGAFWNPETGKFTLARHPVALWFNDFIEHVALVLALFALGGLAYTAWTGWSLLHLRLRHYGFLTLSLLLGPGLIANVLFKNQWGRARPRQIEQFGGDLAFTPPLVIADQCPRNCSFVSGDASMGFALLAVALLIPWARKTWVIAALLFGAFIGLIRIVQGAHFLSDVIYAGIFVSLTIVVLKMLLLNGRERGEPFALSRMLGLQHDGPARTWRRDAFARLGQAGSGGLKRRVWLFFRARPSDFGS